MYVESFLDFFWHLEIKLYRNIVYVTLFWKSFHVLLAYCMAGELGMTRDGLYKAMKRFRVNALYLALRADEVGRSRWAEIPPPINNLSQHICTNPARFSGLMMLCCSEKRRPWF
ncbi:hypothetical protein [Paraburkholderia bonniea]|uniref:hypothetical protein n=1 Tax=Paraburkholderia bonniea TaxID=2152891 RepID=UPI0012924C23|nr:hypothetical protein [Paraburkholderia bonniea]